MRFVVEPEIAARVRSRFHVEHNAVVSDHDGIVSDRIVERSHAQFQRVRKSLLQGPQDCVPCGREGCERHRESRADCLEAIAPERVGEEALLLLR